MKTDVAYSQIKLYGEKNKQFKSSTFCLEGQCFMTKTV